MRTRLLLPILLSLIVRAASAQELLPILSEGKSWRCAEIEYVGQEEPEATYTYFVSGDTHVNGSSYVRLGFKHETSESIKVDTTTVYYNTIGLEKDGVLYCFEKDEEDPTVTHQIVICDMNLHVGDKVWNNQYVTQVDTIEVRGVQRRRIVLNTPLDVWVEGIGSHTDGWPSALPRHNAYDCILACYENGKLIFTEDDFFAPAVSTGISTTERLPRPGSAVYDLQGRRVSGKLSRGIYIRDGHKFAIR